MGVLKIRNAGNSAWIEVGGVGGMSIQDADGDTRVECEANADEDLIRMTVAGSEEVQVGPTFTQFNNIIKLNAGDGYIRSAGTGVLQIQGGASGTRIYNNALSEPGVLSATADGEVTMASQPAFSVYKGAAQNNLAIGSSHTITWGSERFDIGGNFASNIFTAPVTGKYVLTACLDLYDIDTATQSVYMTITTSNTTYYPFLIGPANFAGDIVRWIVQGSVVADMDADDVAYVNITLHNSGTAQIDIPAGITSTFTGALVC